MLLVRAIFSIAINSAVFAVLLFLPAGTLEWRRGWVFVGIVFFGSVASILGLAGRQDLLRERLKPPLQEGQPAADKLLLLAFVACFFGLMAFISLDVFRWDLLGRPGMALSLVGLGLFLAAWVVIYLGLRENAFAAPVVRHQEERGQTLVDTGIYGVVRHPMYAGGVPLIIGMPLWLGSYAGVVAGVLPLALPAARVFVEERMLRRDLAGYEEYMKKVRYRLIPFVW